MTTFADQFIRPRGRGACVDIRPRGALCEIAPGEAPGVVIARFRAAGVAGLSVVVHGQRRYLVDNRRAAPAAKESASADTSAEPLDSPLLAFIAAAVTFALALAVLVGIGTQ